MSTRHFLRRAPTLLLGILASADCGSPTEPQTHHVFVRGHVTAQAGEDLREQIEISLRVPTCSDAPYTGRYYLSSNERGDFGGPILVPSAVSEFDACIVATLTSVRGTVRDTARIRVVRRNQPPDTADFVLAR